MSFVVCMNKVIEDSSAVVTPRESDVANSVEGEVEKASKVSGFGGWECTVCLHVRVLRMSPTFYLGECV